jgi:hypothetical protein
MDIHYGMMAAAIRPDQSSVCYLHRATGEIIAAVPDVGATDSVESEAGLDAALVFLENRRRVQAAPADWLEIPKMYFCGQAWGDNEQGAAFLLAQENFMRDFLKQNGIEGTLR